MKTLLAQIEKELLKADKNLAKAENQKRFFSAKGWNMTEEEGNAFTKASNDFDKYEQIFNTLFTTKKSIERLISL